ncbi:hypothetical protein PIB30_067628 [Stylosanthes scabra]|uniref:Uncharacterized protein n=1 Tax=Stylosanthes scabra TaxID=79078 RepID=A0ABU6WNP1_9FABA|nr:hypothetical protein [Stylosanthes scabra]
MSEERSFLALLHYTGKIKKLASVGIRFSSTEPISVFGSCCSYFSACEVCIDCSSERHRPGGNIPLPEGFSGGDLLIQLAPVAPVVPVIPPCVASPSFAADLHHKDDDGCDLDDNRTFDELVAAVANSPYNVPRGAQISEPEGIEEALGDDEYDEEPVLVTMHNTQEGVN